MNYADLYREHGYVHARLLQVRQVRHQLRGPWSHPSTA